MSGASGAARTLSYSRATGSSGGVGVGGASAKSYARLDRGTYTMLVAACERAGQWRRALAIMEDMRSRGIQFYANPILDGLFAQGVRVWSAAAPLDDFAGGEQDEKDDDDDDKDLGDVGGEGAYGGGPDRARETAARSGGGVGGVEEGVPTDAPTSTAPRGAEEAQQQEQEATRTRRGG